MVLTEPLGRGGCAHTEATRPHAHNVLPELLRAFERLILNWVTSESSGIHSRARQEGVSVQCQGRLPGHSGCIAGRRRSAGQQNSIDHLRSTTKFKIVFWGVTVSDKRHCCASIATTTCPSGACALMTTMLPLPVACISHAIF